MRVHNKKRFAKWKKIALGVSAGLVAFGVVRFHLMRTSDRDAWPAGAPGVSLMLGTSASTDRLATPADVAEVMAGFAEADSALIDAYRIFQAARMESEYGYSYPRIDERLVSEGARFQAIVDFWKRFDGFDPKFGSMPYNSFIGINAEHTMLACYAAANTGRAVEQLPAEQAEARLTVLSNAMKLTHGGGLVGRYAALNSAMLVVREMIMDPIVFADFTAVTSYVSRVRALESEIGDLDEALRTDLISLHEAIAVMYGETTVPSGLAGAGRNPRIGRVGEFVIQMLGGTADDTRANVDALFSRLIRNASQPYSEEGLAKGLPAWCRREARPPSTRDPVGAAVVAAYMKHAVFASVVQPSLVLELRAARIVMALACYKQEKGEYPATLGELVTTGLLEGRDLVDPFAADGALRLSYSRDGEGWRFYSVGLDQVDGGGLVDAYRTSDSTKQKQSDFVFVSREREVRLAMWPEAALKKSKSVNKTQDSEGE